MEKNISKHIKILAIVNFIIHLPSIYLLIQGVIWTITAFTGTAQAGLLIFISVPMIIAGGILFWGCVFSLYVFKLSSSGRAVLVGFSFFSLFIFSLCLLLLLCLPHATFIRTILELREFIIFPFLYYSGIYLINIFYLTRARIKERFNEQE